MAPRADPNDEQVGMNREEESEITSPTALQARERDREAWEQTDRLLRFPPREDSRGPLKDATSAQVARKQWLEENGVQTEFLDGGIGCCWFAHQGDLEPVSGQTEDEAIARLARARGLVRSKA